jgi:hypothetical protein
VPRHPCWRTRRRRPTRKLVVRRQSAWWARCCVGDTADALWYRELMVVGAPIAPLRDKLAFGRAWAEREAALSAAKTRVRSEQGRCANAQILTALPQPTAAEPGQRLGSTRRNSLTSSQPRDLARCLASVQTPAGHQRRSPSANPKTGTIPALSPAWAPGSPGEAAFVSFQGPR